MAQSHGFTLWLTGMSCTGKTTLATYIAARLRQVDRPVEVLDEGEVGGALWGQGLGDTKEERNMAVKRLGFVAQMLTRNGVAAIVAAVSPYKGAREENRRAIGKYVEVFVDCPTETLIQRDSSGNYKRALTGELPNFVGITEPYEPPSGAEVTIRSEREPVEEGALRIFQALLDLGHVTPDELKIITGKKMKANPLPPPAAKKARRETKPAAKESTGAKARPAARAARDAKPAAKKAAAKRKSR